jgi:hypothetical protein
MPDQNESQYFCQACENGVSSESEFCPYCGSLFASNLFCAEHNTPAIGVCLICCEPYCGLCIARINGIWLCADHADYEIYQGHARVYGISDELRGQRR